uniref:ORF30 n=1 Tax=Nitrosopumilaceae spindle-shaped virus TaxID=3065433 RepID=A0AAT9JFJ1_9VIRU
MGVLDVTFEEFREACKSLSQHNKEMITIFRHMNKEKQDEFIEKLQMDNLHVRSYLKDIQKRDEEANTSAVANRYMTGLEIK